MNEVGLRSAVRVLLVPMMLGVLIPRRAGAIPRAIPRPIRFRYAATRRRGGAATPGPYPPGAKCLELSALAVDPQHARTLFAIPAGCKLDKSTDAGCDLA